MKICTLGGSQCKTVPISGLPVLVHPNQTWIFPVIDITIKVPKRRKTWDKSEQILQICGLFPIIQVFFRLHVLTSEIEVINCRNQNMEILLNVITIKVCKMHKKYEVKAYFSRFCEHSEYF